jgi:DNA-binding MarR family transcriptional regulator
VSRNLIPLSEKPNHGASWCTDARYCNAGPVLPCQHGETMSEFDDKPLGFLVRGLMARLRPHAVQALRPLGLGLPEFVCMRILDDDPGRTSAELARHTHVTAQAMNQVLQGLQEIGLVTRPATASSGRALPAQLTRKGQALLKRAESAVATSDEQLLAHLSLADRRQLKRLLYRAGNPSIEDGSVCAQGDKARLD